jgi:hypothetical protein
MRTLFALTLCAPLALQASPRNFYLDIHRFSPSLEGHLNGLQDDKAISFDFQRDLGLEKDAAQLGAALEYQGPRFGVEFSADGQDYAGRQRLEQVITIDDQDFQAGTDMVSAMTVKNYTFNWTIRVLRPGPAWIGVDLGARVWKVELQADGYDPLTAITSHAHVEMPLPIPQLGVSAGFQAFDYRLVGKVYYHFLNRSGASYTHIGADLRAFPLKWLGVRAFFDSEAFKVPKGSIEEDLELQLDRKGAGLGLVLKF